MSFKTKFLSVISFILLFGLTSCSFKSPDESKLINDPKQVVLYFTKIDGNKITLKAVGRNYDSNNSKFLIAVTELLKGPTEAEKLSGLTTEIPQTARVLNFREQRSKVNLDLSSQFAEGGGSSSMYWRYHQLEKTILANHGDKRVYILVEGKILNSLGGEGLIVDNPLPSNKALFSFNVPESDLN
jgi:spore germination protein GerM